MVGTKRHGDVAQRERALHAVLAVGAAGFCAGVAQQPQAALQGGDTPGHGAGHIRQAPDRRDQHQHGRNERHKPAHGHVLHIDGAPALPQRNADHHRQRGGGQQLGQRRHRRRGDGGLDGQAAQAAAQVGKALRLTPLCAMQAHHAVCQHVFFDHIGQLVGGLLAAFGEVVQPPRQGLHDPGDPWNHNGNDQRELPVEVQQIDQQRDQREPVARQAEQGLHQQGGTGLHFIDHRVGERAGRLAPKQSHLCGQYTIKQRLAQCQHAFVGNACQCVLAYKLGHATYEKDPQNRQGHHPQLQGALGKALVQQGLQKGGDQGLRDGAHQCGNNGQAPGHSLVAKVHRQPLQARHQGGGGIGCGGRRRARVGGLHVGRILRLCHVKPVRHGVSRTVCHRGLAAVCNIRVCPFGTCSATAGCQ